MTNYHNLRDKFGRFTKKDTTTTPPRKKRMKKVADLSPTKSILNFFLLDDTGSMQTKVDATIEGFNQVLRDGVISSAANNIRNVDVLAKFGGIGHFIVQDRVSELNKANYYPNNGSTALWWAICEAIYCIETKQTGCDRIILTIFTDGENNAAYSHEAVAKRMIEKKQAEGWVINFVGAGDKRTIEAMSAKVGIFAANTLSYSNDSIGTKSAMRSFSNSRAAYTSAVADGVDSNVGFFSQE